MANDQSGTAIDATVDTFDELVSEGHVLVDIWGPDCQPCLRLMPAVDALAARYADDIRLIKLNAPENRKVCRDLRVAGLPAYLTMRDGVEVERLTSAATTPEQIEAAIVRLLHGATAVGPPVPEHLRGAEEDPGTSDQTTHRETGEAQGEAPGERR
jgi:thioredoxin-like negative regulator of GroEL